MLHRILVVDDRPDPRILITKRVGRRIRARKLDLVLAGKAADALHKLRSDGTMNVVVTDIHIPLMVGLTLLSLLHQHHPLLRSVIISA